MNSASQSFTPSANRKVQLKEVGISLLCLMIAWGPLVFILGVEPDSEVPMSESQLAMVKDALPQIRGFGFTAGVVICVLMGLILSKVERLGSVIFYVSSIILMFPLCGAVFAVVNLLHIWLLSPVLFRLYIPIGTSLSELFYFSIYMAIYSFMAVTFAWGAKDYLRRQRERVERLQMEAALKDAQMAVLRNQINPHFLFNALNSVRASIPTSLDVPRTAISQLSGIFRASLSADHRQTISLEDELATVRNYLALEGLRLGTRLSVEWSCGEEELGLAQVPPFLVQLLVENAVKHGISILPEGGVLKITIWRAGHSLRIRVMNSGRLLNVEQGSRAEGGTGLQNARARLRLLFGQEAALLLSQSSENEVTADLTLPFVTSLE